MCEAAAHDLSKVAFLPVYTNTNIRNISVPHFHLSNTKNRHLYGCEAICHVKIDIYFYHAVRSRKVGLVVKLQITDHKAASSGNLIYNCGD
jgi:hypothetical protein